MRGVVVPERDEDFAADPSELFFDLVYVFAFSRLVYHLVHEPTWTGVGEFALLFTMIWLPWTQMTWSANAVSCSARPVRLLVLVATVASVPMAGAVNSAFDDGGTVFAVSLGVILAMGLFAMISGLGHDDPIRRSILEYSVPNVVAIVVMVTGSVFDRPLRIGFWIAAMAIVTFGTIRAGRSEWLVRPGHFAERHGLIIIVGLGEVIVALGAPVSDALNADGTGGLPARLILALIAAGTFACLIWWGYFDRPHPALEHRHEGHDGGRQRARFARDVYTYAHLPIVAGVVLSAAALEQITAHPNEQLADPFRWMLVGGIGLYLLGVVVSILRAFGVLAVERLIGSAAVLVAVLALADADAVVVLVAVDVVLAAMLVIEHHRIEIHDRTIAVRRATPLVVASPEAEPSPGAEA